MYIQAQMGDETFNKSFPMLLSKRAAVLPFSVKTAGEFISDSSYFTKRSGLNQCLLMYTVSGEGIVEYEGKEYTLEPGQLMVLDCRELHYYATKVERWHFLWIHFLGQCAFDYERYLNADGSRPLFVGNRVPIQSYYEKIVAQIVNNTPQSEFKISVLLHRMLTDLIELRQREVFSSKYSGHQNVLEESIAFLGQHFQQDISVEQLARNCHLSKYYYIKMFKAYTGQTPYEYLIDIRLQRAQSLLLQTELPVEAVAVQTGFSESKNFIACFKKKLGITPLQFRKQNKLA